MADPKLTGVDWDMINKDAESWAREFGGQLVKDIDKGTRRDVGNAVGDFYSEGHTMGELGDRLGRIYSPQRAERIAITEVTRAAAEGERGIKKELAKDGIIMVEVWQTRNDDVVCEICRPRNGVEEHKGDGDAYWDSSYGPPGHPNCRCNIRLDYEKTKEDAIQIEEAADFMEDISAVDPLEGLEYEEGIQPSTDVYSDEEWEKITDWYLRDSQGGPVDIGNQFDRGRVKDEIINELAERSGLEYEDVNDMIANWASTSNDSSPAALQMQERASRMFGIDLSDWQEQAIIKTEGYLPTRTPSPFTDDQVDKFLKAMYDNTQTQLRAAGIDNVKLLRGIDLDAADLRALKETGLRNGDTIIMNQNTMESWTLNESTSKDFGNLIIEVDVPVDRIIGSARTGFGCLDEYEFIVLGSNAEESATIVKLGLFGGG